MRFLTSLAVVMSLWLEEWPTSRDEISIHRRNMSQHEIHCRNMSRHEMPIHCANIKLIVPCVNAVDSMAGMRSAHDMMRVQPAQLSAGRVYCSQPKCIIAH